MKNQSFHQRKIRIQETPSQDFGQLKARTVNALGKLGEQKFSSDPGGYTLENWTKGLNLLLDDFEEKAGSERLTPGYLARRRELDDRLSKPVSTSGIDDEMSQLRTGMSGIESKLDAERARITTRISELKAEQASCSGELEKERRQRSVIPAQEKADSFLTRLFGRSKGEAKDSGNRIRELETKSTTLTNEALEQQKKLNAVDDRSPGSPFAGDWNQLESMQTKLDELEKERLEKVQLVKERVEATGSMADAISRIT